MTDSSTIILGAVLCVVGVGGSALCSGLETGFYALNRIRLRIRASGEDRRAIVVQEEVAKPDRLLTAMLMWNNLFNYIGSLGLTTVLLSFGFSEVWVIVLQALVLTPLLLIFAETLPKEVFRVRADDLPYRLIGLVRVLRWLSWPVLVIVLGVVHILARFFGGEARQWEGGRRIAALLKEGVLHGAISPVQAALIDDAMDLAKMTIGNLGVPMGKVAIVPEGASEDQFRAAARRAGSDPVVVIDKSGQVKALVGALAIGLGQVELNAPLRLDHALGVREGLAAMASAGVYEAVVTRDGRDVGVVTRRRVMQPLLRSIHSPHGNTR